MLDELDGRSAVVSITGYCDLDKFYDSTDILKLIHHALACEFPLQPLAIVARQCCASFPLRVLRSVPVHLSLKPT